MATLMPLMGHSGWFFDVESDATNKADTEDSVVVLRRWVTTGYFEGLDVRLVKGRGFDDFDGRGEDAFVAVVNESFVRSHIPAGLDPIGQRIRTGTAAPWETIVGVAADVKDYGLDQDSRPSVYEPVRQRPAVSAHVALVSSGPVDAVLADVRRATQSIDAELPLYDVQTMRERIDNGLLARRASSWLIALFSAVALVLAVAGLYGVISYGVGQRAPEMGIRLALGAQRRDVQALVIRQGLLIVAVGLVLGTAAAAAAARGVSSVLVTGGAGEAQVVAGVVGLVLAIAVVANYLPARRAGNLNPVSLLRRD
jgi:putative ABC transport system permease protein